MHKNQFPPAIFQVHDATRRTGRRLSQCSWVDEISVGVWSQANGRQKMLRIERTVCAMIPNLLASLEDDKISEVFETSQV